MLLGSVMVEGGRSVKLCVIILILLRATLYVTVVYCLCIIIIASLIQATKQVQYSAKESGLSFKEYSK